MPNAILKPPLEFSWFILYLLLLGDKVMGNISTPTKNGNISKRIWRRD